ncbi:MAG: acyl-CoA desaturase [Flavobacteriales bacterium]|jgi:stearoyl-CoA desaturase (delta-9 desaturase)|nr:acyl-CoA desaturase [Flavobacteriales bacterium]MBK6753547.1 acyl-CoA desaturase [Flavobacteriales bacterium]MBK7083669.1 acyl-CoA desaturase [Flavobacteriales bacterium]MBK7269906.1 acyl-CoA desaturase [Flavobacteriales bacterium]MBK7753499.1 acyl-CoA desaturase [Flavobacteriales bacterium]
MTAILVFFVLHWYLSLFVQTFYLHRYAAHGMFTMSSFWEKVFHVLTFIAQGSSYLSPYAYGVLHRLHHAYADTENDPHSPKYDPSLFSMMWRTKTVYHNIFYRKMDLEERFTKGVPSWPAMENFADTWPSRIAWMALYTTFYVAFAPSYWWFLLLPLHFVMGPLHGAIINWYAHKYGYRNYEVKDTSRNMLPVELVVMGEGLHNNHHANSARANFAIKWWEFDPTWPIIRALHALRVIRLTPAALRA